MCAAAPDFADPRTEWRFFWTAPAAGSGEVTLFGGVGDGNCMMDSLDDDINLVSGPIIRRSRRR